ncbi:MAG: type II toxin-antitoxin system VapC family toxin [Deltaproteobacteria bacterium]|nr:type II toxin-antitoxin system VapC family toxin [Deltaproteobacteria bacterium]
MRLLLDTCSLIWLAAEPARLTKAATRALDDEENTLLVSHASIWEIYNKCASGKLTLPGRPCSWVSDQIAIRGADEVPIDRAALDRMSELPLHHRDPFDRVLAAQALVHGLTIVSPDRAFDPYGARRLWS